MIQALRTKLRAPSAGLPERVRRLIAVEQQKSEIIISWVQMTIVVLFSTLYAVSPRPTDAIMAAAAVQSPVPWFLGAYFLFTCLRLFLAHRRRLPPWFLTVSILFDIGLLMGLIWSFHVSYQQVPAFYLKAPTLLYVFIFIALRALRFEARYVALAGIVSALGWLALVIYAATNDPGGMPVTRNYVAYMTSAMILWGAEIDKIVSILTVTALLAAAISRARRRLESAVGAGAAVTDLSRFFARDVAERITGAEESIKAGQGELRHAACLFTDLRGFTLMARDLPPDRVIALLGEYQALVVPIVRAHGGAVDKFLGDGILASFGCTRPSDTYAADALRAVDAIMTASEGWARELAARGLPPARIGAAVAAGEVLFGAVGTEQRLEYTVIGDTVNLAAKLEKHNKAEKVNALTDAATYALARRQGYEPAKETRSARAVAGVDQPMDLAVLA